MNAIKSMSASLESDYEDLDNIHKKLSKKFHNHVTDKDESDFDDNHRNLVNAIAQIANAKLGIFRNYKLQKQIDELLKIVQQIPADVRAEYVSPQLLEILGE